MKKIYIFFIKNKKKIFFNFRLVRKIYIYFFRARFVAELSLRNEYAGSVFFSKKTLPSDKARACAE
jgi:hypothetical protein